MAQLTIQLVDDKELNAKLTALPDKVQAKVMRRAIGCGLMPIARQARNLQRHASLRKLIGTKVVKRKRDREWVGKVYLKPSKERTIMIEGREIGFEVVGNILEFGSAKRNIKPQPFMRAAREQAGGAAIAAVANQAVVELKKLGAT